MHYSSWILKVLSKSQVKQKLKVALPCQGEDQPDDYFQLNFKSALPKSILAPRVILSLLILHQS